MLSKEQLRAQQIRHEISGSHCSRSSICKRRIERINQFIYLLELGFTESHFSTWLQKEQRKLKIFKERSGQGFEVNAQGKLINHYSADIAVARRVIRCIKYILEIGNIKSI